jgi:hypothetical protein
MATDLIRPDDKIAYGSFDSNAKVEGIDVNQ